MSITRRASEVNRQRINLSAIPHRTYPAIRKLRCLKIVMALGVCFVLVGFDACFAQEVRVFKIKHARASDLAEVALSLVTTAGKVSADDNTNSLIVIDYPQIIERIAQVIDELDCPREQVEIKVTIIDATERVLREAGITSVRVMLPSGAGGAVVKMLSEIRDSQIRSEMKVVTLSGQSAQLQVSADEIFGRQVVSFSDGTMVESFERKPVGEFLEVVPQVNKDRTITVSLRPTQSTRKNRHAIEESTVLTQVKLHSGDTLVIGSVESRTDSPKGSVAKQVVMFLSVKIVE